MINYNIIYLGYLITLLLGIPQSYGNSTMVMMMLIMTMMVIHNKKNNVQLEGNPDQTMVVTTTRPGK